MWDCICFAKKTDWMEKFWKSSKIFENSLDKTDLLWYNNYVVKQQRLNIMWRSRVVGRARATGNRVTTKNSSRVRISPSPPKIVKRVLVDFFIQTVGLVYHHASACISSRRVSHHTVHIFFGLDEIQDYVLMIYNSLGIDDIQSIGN